MPIPLKQFYEAYAAAQGSWPERIERLLQHSDQAHTAEEVAAHLLGASGAYRTLLSPEISAVLPLVKLVLDQLVHKGQLRCMLMETTGLLGPKTYYAKNQVEPAL